jgi:putative inorganic carbon (hco3(-)) transporter
MVEPHGAAVQEVQYVPRQETRPVTSTGPSIWLILMAGILIPGALALGLAMNETAYAIAAFLALIVGSAILAQPFIGLLVFLALVYSRPEELFPAITGMRLTLILTALTLFGTWLHIFVNRERMTKTPVIGFMLAIAVIAPLSNIFVEGEYSEAMRQVWMLGLLLLLLLNLIRTRARFQAFVTALIGVTAYLAGYSIYLAQQGIAYIQKEGEERSQRVLTEGSIFSDPNDLASALVPGIALVMMRFVQVKGWRKVPYALIGALMLYATFQTQSRGGFIALIVTLGVFVIMTSKRRIMALGIASVIAVGVIAGASDRMTTIDAEEDSAQSRMQYWQNGFDELRESPLFGAGYDNYQYLNPNNQAPHNSFMQALVELGPIGFFFFMGLFYYAFRKPTAAARDELPTEQDRLDLLGVRISLVGFMVAAFFLTRAFVPCLYIHCCLPLVQQISASGRTNILEVNGKERFRDWFWILCWCIAMVVFIKLLLIRYL